MPATEVVFGITRVEGSLIEEVTSKDSVQIAELLGSTGEVAIAKDHKKMTEFTVKGHGPCDVAVGIGESGVTGISGGLTIIKDFENAEKNDGFSGWTYSGVNYPEASALT